MLNGEVKFDANDKIRSLKINYPFKLEWSDIPDLVVLAGKNGSGKASLFELINRKFYERQKQKEAGGSAPLQVLFRSSRFSNHHNQELDNRHVVFVHDLIENIENDINPESIDWISDATKIIDNFDTNLKSKSNLNDKNLPASLLLAKPMSYLVELVDGYNQFVFELTSNCSSSSSSTSEEVEARIESRREKLRLLFETINLKLIKYELGYRIAWKQFVSENNSRKYQENYQTMLTLISTENPSVHVFYGDFAPGNKMIFDIVVWTSLIEQDMLEDVALILLDQPDAHLNACGLDTFIRIIKSFILNCAVLNKSIQMMMSTNRVDFLRHAKEHFPHDFAKIGVYLKVCNSTTASSETSERRIEAVPNTMV